MTATKKRSAGLRPRIYLGKVATAKIQAVEGIELTAEMKRMFREFDRLGLPDAERRRRIIARYGAANR